MAKNDKNKSPEKLIMTRIGIIACVFLVCSWITNAFALNGFPEVLLIGIGFALGASITGGIGISKNKKCKASSAALSIGLIVFAIGIIIQIVGIEVFLT